MFDRVDVQILEIMLEVLEHALNEGLTLEELIEEFEYLKSTYNDRS